MIQEGNALPINESIRRFLMNCLCRLFDDSTLWLIIIAVILFSSFCNGCGNGCGYGCGTNSVNNGCGCSCG